MLNAVGRLLVYVRGGCGAPAQIALPMHIGLDKQLSASMGFGKMCVTFPRPDGDHYVGQ
jgi:hypothetical protein